MRVKGDEVEDVLIVPGSNRETEQRRGRAKGPESIEERETEWRRRRAKGLVSIEKIRVWRYEKGRARVGIFSGLRLSNMMGLMAQTHNTTFARVFVSQIGWASWPKLITRKFLKTQSPADVSKRYNVIGRFYCPTWTSYLISILAFYYLCDVWYLRVFTSYIYIYKFTVVIFFFVCIFI